MLFVCVENACRSLMAEAMFNARPPDGWRAFSAGTEPARSPNPRTGPMLEEIGLALPPHPPRMLTAAMIDAAEIVVTMGCLDHDRCPARLSARGPRDWALPDPARLEDDGFRRVRRELYDRVGALIAELGRAEGVPSPTAAGR